MSARNQNQAATPTSANVRNRFSAATIAGFSLLTLVLIVGAIAAGLYSHGHRWFIVATPSMGTTAPVGTFILTTPADTSDLAVGDIISFRPPTTPDEVYTHRIETIDADGTVHTRGDINGASDPWALTDADLVGKATTVAPYLGWIFRAIPYLAIGLLALFTVTGRILTGPRLASARIVGTSVIISVTSFVLRPWTNMVMLTNTVEDGQATTTVVSTGVLPIRVEAKDGTTADLLPGELGIVSTPTDGHIGRYEVLSTVNLPWWGWVIFAVICLLPLIWCITVGLPAATDSATEPALDVPVGADATNSHPSSDIDAEIEKLLVELRETIPPRMYSV